jgi:methylenetetrahydrofolate reductase (NADPH)
MQVFEFVAKAREMGITVPIIPGIKPLAVQRHLQIYHKFSVLICPKI